MCFLINKRCLVFEMLLLEFLYICIGRILNEKFFFVGVKKNVKGEKEILFDR